jgi:Tat protein secretion system quality control protein TatD with DNase activity
MERVLVETDAPREVIADHLHEVEHLEGARELEPDNVMTVCRHVCATRHSINTISSVMSRRRGLFSKVA